MNTDELNKLVCIRKMTSIRRKLRKLGYRCCERDKRFRDLDLSVIYKAESDKTETFTTDDGDYMFYGNIYGNVDGYEDLEFIEICQNKIYRDRDFSFPYRIYFYVKPADR